MNVAVRISYPATRLASWFSSIAMVSEKVVFVEHSENVARVHIHGYVVGCSVTTETLKNWLTKALNLEKKAKKSDISFKNDYTPYGALESIPVDDGAISYMSKGKYDPCYIKGWTKEEYDVYKSKGYDKKELNAHEKEKENTYIKTYNQFITYEYREREQLPDDVRCLPMDFYDVRKMAWKFCMTQFKVASPQCLTHYKSIVLTYCFNYNVKIPAKEIKFQI